MPLRISISLRSNPDLMTLRTIGIALMPITIALSANPGLAHAEYTEHFMTRAELAEAQSRSSSTPRRKTAQKNPASPHQTPARTTTSKAADDPIAAFADAPHAQTKKAHR